jgi:microcystin degradation protein MlrC
MEDPVRVVVGGIMHESNTFASVRTGLAGFRIDRGPELIARWAGTHHEMAGFLEGAALARWDLIPTVMAGATPAGPVTAEAFETVLGELTAAIRAADAVDGMLLAVHGAMVADGYPDGDGEIIRRVREALPEGVPLVVTLDFHANLSAKMVEHSSAILVYQTNPHVDQRPRGARAAALLARILRGEVRPVQALAQPPMIWNILHQNTSAEPLRGIMADAARLEDSGALLAASVSGGYQYADVVEVGPSALVVADGDGDAARREADRLAGLLWEARERIPIALPEPAEAVARAGRSERPPVVIVEMGDNIGGGSPGDSTAILAELVRQGAERAVTVITDPEAAHACATAGVGAEVALDVGGKTDGLHGSPVRIAGRVRSLHDGRFHEPQPRHGGVTDWDQGLTAVVQLPTGTLVALNSKRTMPASIHQLTSLGIQPERMRILVVKAAIAYRAAYEPIAGEIIESDTPGVTAVNPLRFTYRHARRPLWPLDGA